MASFSTLVGAAEIIRETGAKNMVMDGDVSVVETGARTDFLSPSPNIPTYAPVHVDRVLHDGDTVSLGAATLTAHKTAGHTRGCTTWTMRSHLPGEPGETMRNIVIVGGTGFWSEYRFVATPGHPVSYSGIVQDFQHTFSTLHALPCDIFLGAHGGYFDMLTKLKHYPQNGPHVLSIQTVIKSSSPTLRKLSSTHGSNSKPLLSIDTPLQQAHGLIHDISPSSRKGQHSRKGQPEMRKIKIIEHISLDGIIQAPGGPDEDGDYPYGGWAAPYDDDSAGDAILAAHGERFDLLLGRRTYDIWAAFWPTIKGNPMADSLNAATKYVATHRPGTLAWGPFESLGPDLVEGVHRIKATAGPHLVVWGSSTLTSVLLEHGLADEIVLLVYPILLGQGKRFFSDRTPPRELTLTATKAASCGIVISTYKPSGPLRTSSFNKPEDA